MSETDLKRSALRYLKKKGYFVKYHSGYGGASGVPDLLGCFKGKFIAIELKFGDNKTSPLQDHHIDEIRKSGGVAMVCRSMDEIRNFFDKEVI